MRGLYASGERQYMLWLARPWAPPRVCKSVAMCLSQSLLEHFAFRG